jgi:signal peptidase I
MPDTSMAETFIDLFCGSSDTVTRLPVLSNSMAPVLISGDEVIVLPCTWEHCTAGDIIVFRQGLSLVVHRYIYFIKKPGKSLVLQKGDAMERGYFIHNDSIIGKGTVRIREGVEKNLTVKNENRNVLRIQRFKILIYTGREVLKWSVKKLRTFRLPLGQ